ncbi:hypothetical protein Drorol1_Dr00008558 [Drosera rotundifolia]
METELQPRKRSSSELPIKTIVFSQWTGMLDLFEISLNQPLIRYRRFDGGVESQLSKDAKFIVACTAGGTMRPTQCNSRKPVQGLPLSCKINLDLVPGIAFRQQSPHLELRGAEIQILACCEPQRLFYQEAKIEV